MRPPICDLCGTRFDPDAALVRFADYEPLPEGVVGHPRGLAWFCGRHLAAARSLTDRSEGEALKRLRMEADASPPGAEPPGG